MEKSDISFCIGRELLCLPYGGFLLKAVSMTANIRNTIFDQRSPLHLEVGFFYGGEGGFKTVHFNNLKKKNPAYGRQSISRPVRIVAPIPRPRIPKNQNF